MNEESRVELPKSANGGRVLRLEHTAPGRCLEKRLDTALPVAVQTGRWSRVFAALLERALLVT